MNIRIHPYSRFKLLLIRFRHPDPLTEYQIIMDNNSQTENVV